MQLSSVILSALLAISAQAVPQNNAGASTSTATVSQVATTTSAALTPQQTCLKNCSPSDVNCQAACVSVPHPDESQMHDVTSCVAQCDQGDGSAEATAKYADCSQKCISSIILASGTAAAGGSGATPASKAASATGSAASKASSAASSGASKASSAESSASSAASSASSSASAAANAAANDLQKGAAVAGLAGIVMAMFAL